MSVYRCPDWPEPDAEIDIRGCGRTITAEPDDEDLVDCPHCGIWFKAEQGIQ